MARIAELQGEQGINEVNGGDRSYTLWERFLCRVQAFLVILFVLAAEPLANYAIQNWNFVR
jgi:hypothetical protein